jgi:hypothetical protein
MPRKKSSKPAGKVGAKKAGLVFQFKVTLESTQPAIWRRIQVPNGTLDTGWVILAASHSERIDSLK